MTRHDKDPTTKEFTGTVEEIGYSVRYFTDSDFCSYTLIADKEAAEKEYSRKSKVYRRVDLLEAVFTVLKSTR